MKTRPTVFISGVTHEFKAFRNAVENEVKMKGCFPHNQPGFPTDYREVEEMLRLKIAESDAVICIVGFRFGGEPNNRPDGVPRRSYTQMEFDIAGEFGIPVYVFFSAQEKVRDHPRTELPKEDAEAVQIQQKHRDALSPKQANRLSYEFMDKAELCKLVAEIQQVAVAGFQTDVSRILKYAPEHLIGRDDEWRLLDDAWNRVRHPTAGDPVSSNTNILTFVALGGEGKTSLVAKWAAKLAGDNWPGCDAALAWSFYSQGTWDRGDASADVFLAASLRFFGDEAMADSAASAWNKGKRLAELVSERRTLLILDGLEPLQYSPTSPMKGELKEPGLIALLTALAAKNPGMCIVTTRYAIPDLNNYRETTAPQHELLRLSTEAGVHLLKTLGVRENSGTLEEFESLVEDVKGHALTLNLLGTYLADAHAGDIRRRDRVTFAEADAEVQGGHAFRVMDAYVKWFESEGDRGRQAIALLQLMGLFDRAATGGCILALKQPPVIDGLTETLVGLGESKRNIALKRLEEAKLLSVDRDVAGTLLALDCHPLIREYFAKRLQEQQQAAWQAGHARLFEHLCETTKEGAEPSLEQLQPLYQAVTHGCLAGRQRQALYKVFINRILKGTESEGNYSLRKLGAFGADLGTVSCFFDEPWTSVSPTLTVSNKSWMLGGAAFRLRSLGRLREALEPMRASLKMEVKQEDWQNAASAASNLSELSLLLGDVSAAVDNARMSVDYADRSPDEFLHMVMRATLADALHLSGRLDEARRLFAKAEQMQKKRQPHFYRLYALQGFRYCDLLLSSWEHRTWQSGFQPVHPGTSGKEGKRALGETNGQDGCATLEDIEERATLILSWTIQVRASLLDIALDHLTLARVTFCRSQLDQTLLPDPQDPASHVAQAVDGLRKSGLQDFLPSGLLTLAWYQHEQGDEAAAHATLNEAEAVASRGPMPLHLADIHLYRARLFGDAVELECARKLIDKHSYERRHDELNDATAWLSDP